MAEDHDWHLFDELNGLEARHISGKYEVREVGKDGPIASFTPEEFDRFRGGDPDSGSEPGPGTDT